MSKKNNDVEVKETDVAKNKKQEKVDVKPVITQKEIEKKLKRANNDKIIIISIVAVALIIAFSIFGVYFYKTSLQSVVTFDGGKITKSEYTIYYKRFANMLQYYGYPASMIPEYIANIAASDKILLEKAEEAGITISDENKKAVEDMFADKDEVKAIKDAGIDPTAMKKLYYNQYVILQYIDKIAADASNEDITNYIKENADKDTTPDMNEYNTRHILFKTTTSTGTEMTAEELNAVKAKAEAALARVQNGEDFATVAKELSEDTGTKADGGAFTMYMDGNVLEEYVAAVKTLQAGQMYATLVKTDAGYHIIKLDSIVENGRVNNKTERDAYANALVDKVGESKNIKVNTNELNKLIEQLTGQKIDTTENNTTTNETENNTTTDENNTTGNNTAE